MAERRQRLWLAFDVGGSLKWLGHLDLFRTWERVLRRADLPLLYSQGFNPRPRMAIALPLPLGLTGEGELLDVLLTHPVPPLEIAHGVHPQLPTGLMLRGVEEVDLGVPSLQSQLRAAEYVVRLKANPEDLSRRMQELLAVGSCLRQRRGREYDLRPLVRALYKVDRSSDFSRSLPQRPTEPVPWTGVATPSETSHGQSLVAEQVLVMELEAGDRGTGRPDEVLLALGLDPQEANIHRRSVRFAFDK